jgi:hypothetical protein
MKWLMYLINLSPYLYIIQMMKPACFYNRDGSIREFGIGYRNKTILPIWLLSLVLGILCYLAVLYYVNTSKIY